MEEVSDKPVYKSINKTHKTLLIQTSLYRVLEEKFKQLTRLSEALLSENSFMNVLSAHSRNVFYGNRDVGYTVYLSNNSS
jgi:hypothetical protein